MEACTTETIGSANLNADMELDWTFIEEGIPVSYRRSFELEPPRTVWKWETEWELEEINRGESSQGRKLEEISGGIALWRPNALEWSNRKLTE